MKTVTVKQIQMLDRVAIQKMKIPSIILMENAGRAVTQEILRVFKKQKSDFISVICGYGNNAGDGFVVARHLDSAGIKTKVFLLADPKCLKPDPTINYQILKKLKIPVRHISRIEGNVFKDLRKSRIIVDAIFGVGLNREITGALKNVIEILNKTKKRIVSIDVPSGLDGTTGKIYGVCIKAFMTVTFSFLKKGFLIKKGPVHTGKTVVVDIGIPRKLMNKIK